MNAELQKVRVEPLLDGKLWQVTLAAPKGNVIDAVMTGELTRVFQEARAQRGLAAVILQAEGKHFSFGASVEEHRADQVEAMLTGFHDLFFTMADAGIPVIAAVRGQCLGGGLELAAFCHRVIASSDARLGQPEIVLGVFAPVASAVLPHRLGRGAADDLLLSGRSVTGEEALAIGLVDELSEMPEEAALQWAKQHLVTRSAMSLRFAARAARLQFVTQFKNLIPELTRIYLEELMSTHDAVEGIEAFLAKRQPTWSHA